MRVATGSIIWPALLTTTVSDGSTVLDATTDYVAFVFTVPKTGTIDSVTIRTGSSSLSGTLSVQLQTLDSSGNPSGTAYGSSAQVDQTNPAATTNYTFSSLGCSATVGDTVCVNVWASTVTSGSVTVLSTTSSMTIAGAVPYVTYRTSGTGAGTHGSSPGVYALAYTGSDYPPLGILPCGVTYAGVGIDADGTVRRIGNCFDMPFSCTVVGLAAALDNDGDTTTLELYDTDGTTVLGTCTLATAERGSTSVGTHYGTFDDGAEVTLLANPSSPYRAVINTTSTAGNVNGRGFTSVPSLASLGNVEGGECVYGTTHNGTAWTDYTTTNSVRRYMVSLLIKQIDDGTGLGRTQMLLGGLN